jgi:hypothetical protein
VTADRNDLPAPESGWEPGWDGHERAQRERIGRLSMAEKLRWLEEAHALALTLLGEEGFRKARERRVGTRPT